MLFFAGAVFILALLLAHPLCLCFLAVIGSVGVGLAGGRDKLWSFWRLNLILASGIVLFNVFFNRAGQTLLFAGLPFTWEALFYGACMALRLYALGAAWALVSLTVRLEELLAGGSLSSSKAGLAMALGLRLFPLVQEEQQRLAEAVRARGLNPGGGPWRRRWRNWAVIGRPLLNNTLERAWQMAAIMQARGYGGGRRTALRRRRLARRDWLVIAGASLGLGFGMVALATGAGAYAFYPALTGPAGLLTWRWLAPMGAAFLLPLLLAWGWQRWQWLRSII